MAIRDPKTREQTADFGDPGAELRPLQLLLVQGDAGEAAWTLRRIIGTSVLAEVMRASTLADAFEKLRMQTFDAVFLDLEIAPDLDGEVCRQLIELSERPVVALARHDDPARLEEALAAGVSAYYLKRPSVKGVFRRRRMTARRANALAQNHLAAVEPTGYEAWARG